METLMQLLGSMMTFVYHWTIIIGPKCSNKERQRMNLAAFLCHIRRLSTATISFSAKTFQYENSSNVPVSLASLP